MGEQSQNPTQPHHDTTAVPSTTTSTTTTTQATTTDVANVAPHNTFLITKIPLRPKKIRKFSVDAPSDDTKSPKSAKKNKIVPYQPKPLQKLIPVRSLSCDGEIESALRHLRAADPLLAPLIDVHHPPTFYSFDPPFLALTKSIIYQQLAYKAGTLIYTRFVSLCGGEKGVIPDTILTLTLQQLRQVGVSVRKASYLHDLARKYQNGILSDSSIVRMDDKSLFTMLTMVNGIGSWSVHMFMIFSLHRPDVLPISDLGVRKGVQLLYGLEELPRPSQMEQLCEKWRPYRSVAAWYMWRFVEAKGTPPLNAGTVTPGTALLFQHQEQETHQHQFLDPMNGILNLGVCAWRHNDRDEKCVHENVLPLRQFD